MQLLNLLLISVITSILAPLVILALSAYSLYADINLKRLAKTRKRQLMAAAGLDKSASKKTLKSAKSSQSIKSPGGLSEGAMEFEGLNISKSHGFEVEGAKRPVKSPFAKSLAKKSVRRRLFSPPRKSPAATRLSDTQAVGSKSSRRAKRAMTRTSAKSTKTDKIVNKRFALSQKSIKKIQGSSSIGSKDVGM